MIAARQIFCEVAEDRFPVLSLCTVNDSTIASIKYHNEFNVACCTCRLVPQNKVKATMGVITPREVYPVERFGG